MAELFIHLGHGKTGTTYIQNALALSADRLFDAGIAYPLPPAQRARIERNHARINSGNGGGLLSRYGKGVSINIPDAEKVLFSSESLFHEIGDERGASASMERLRRDFSAIHALLFVRDPVDFAVSAYQQEVKRHGYTGSVDAYLESNDYISGLATTLGQLSRYPGLRLTVYNYSRRKHELLFLFENWLGIEPSFLTRPKHPVVNRSLTERELRVQRAMNRLLGQSGNLFADWVCQLFPNRAAAHLRPCAAVERAFWERNRNALDRVNGLLPPEARFVPMLSSTAAENGPMLAARDCPSSDGLGSRLW
ncbi:hypothetical protein [Solirhodobacter olei]|uniref:hypothetical protein n=1 Tax=Solirhodobacter olei TaxID=2493082 RepID=UPI000FD8313A|nr:hypothetical protein [Solirhodobacter olei]